MTDMIEKIVALRGKIPENGATEQEALAALALADKLMVKHGLTEADLRNVDFARDMRSGSFTQKQKAIHPSQKYSGTSIAAFCGVKAWTQHIDNRKQNIRMFGMKGDVTMAEFLMGLVHDSMDRGWKEFLKTNVKRTNVSRHTEYWSFMIGFADTINNKLQDLVDAREVYMDSTGTDLVVVKNSLVEEGLASMLPSLRTKKSSGSTRVTGDAYSKGQTAGDKVNLSRPINKQSSAGTRMIS